MGAKLNITNQKFGRLTALSPTKLKYQNKILWNCECDCGKFITATTNQLKTGNTTSCGCYKKEILSKHKMSKTSEYIILSLIKQRCLNKKSKDYKHYGSRGITICDRWLESFENFYKDMGPRPSLNHSIDRIDNNGNYEPSNCRWATKKEQANNTTRNVYFIYNGTKLSIENISIITGLKSRTIRSSISRCKLKSNNDITLLIKKLNKCEEKAINSYER